LMLQQRHYERMVVAALCLAWSVVNAEFLGINYLMPFVAASLRLSNTQVGILVSVFWIPFAFASYFSGVLTDRLGKRKRALTAVLVVFSLASFVSGLTSSFGALLAARLAMGLLEGPILPLAQSIVALETPIARRAMNMGIVQSVGPGVIAGLLAPLLLVTLAVRYGWRSGFFVGVVPGLVCAGLLAYFLREPQANPSPAGRTDVGRSEGEAVGIRQMLGIRNIWLCSALSILFVTQSLIGLGYLPLFYVRDRHLPPGQMSELMSLWGVASIVFGLAIPALADRIGRKQAAIIASLMGVICPLAALYYPGPLPILGFLMFLGWAPVGASILFMATIPAESVPARSITTAIGLTFATGTLIGGGAGPSVAGWIADTWGLRVSLLLAAAVCAAMAAISLALWETGCDRQTRDG
jgi:MFS family permease